MPDHSSPFAVEARQLVKTYRLYSSTTRMAMDRIGLYRMLFWLRPEFKEFNALNGVDIRIRKGERVGFIGRNGAGKTTFLKLLTGNFVPSAGQLTVRGSVQALMQTGLGFHPEFTGRDNIRSGLEYNGLQGDELESALQEIVDFAELGQFIDQPFATYSAGMQLRLQFATATAIRPDILIVDEVLGAGDAYFSAKSFDRMNQLTRGGCTLLLVSHSMQQVIQFCERVIWLDGGRVLQDGPAREVVSAYETYMFRLRHGGAVLSAGSEAAAGGPSERHGTEPIPDSYRNKLAALMQGQEEVAEENRWINDPRLRIVRACAVDKDGHPASVFGRGAQLSFELVIEAQEAGAYDCWVVVLLYGNDGKPLTRHVSDKQVLQLAKGGRWIARVTYPRLLIGTGEYHASVAIYRFWDPNDRSAANWYEILNRSIAFKIDDALPYDPALFSHPAEWDFAAVPQ